MSKRAEEAALKVYPKIPDYAGVRYDVYRGFIILGYEQAEKDILSIIQSRLEEIYGDAQPRPVLRMELQELINKIENGDN